MKGRGKKGDGASSVILGLGNILLSDEGVGVHALTALKRKYFFPPDVDIIDGGTMGLDLLPFFQDRDRILILDAVDFRKSPGHIEIVEGDAIPSVLNTKLSVHHIGLSDLLFAAKLTRTNPLQVSLIGMQPKSLDAGIGLTDEINDRVESMIELALVKLKEWNIDVCPRDQEEDRRDLKSNPKPPSESDRREASFFFSVIR